MVTNCSDTNFPCKNIDNKNYQFLWFWLGIAVSQKNRNKLANVRGTVICLKLPSECFLAIGELLPMIIEHNVYSTVSYSYSYLAVSTFMK